jgi:uncharacterized protein (TIGR02996 family)
MSQDKAFIAATKATPLDDPGRLIYADWLEEQGDPRAEFIRLQTEMSRLLPTSDEYVAKRSRSHVLQKQIKPTWLKTMAYVPRHTPLFTELPARRLERWRLVEQFIENWFTPLEPKDGYSEVEIAAAEQRLGFRLPGALREWYALAGSRSNVWSNFNYPTPLSELALHPSEGLVIRYECQNCERWAIPQESLTRDDPPVVEVIAGGEASPTVTAFACHVLLDELKYSGRALHAGGDLPVEMAQDAVADLSKCDIVSQYRGHSLNFFEGSDVIVLTGENPGATYFEVTARNRKSYGQFSKSIRRRLHVYFE